MNKKLNIQKLWNSYNETVIPKAAMAIQRQECQRAFYAGCHSMLTMLIEVTETTTEQQGGAFIEGLIEEIKQFSEQQAG